jgi:tetratricopeptide (TPR) repeat protein
MLKALFYSTCIFLFAILSASRVYASDYFLNALGIYAEGKYFEASIEFERAIFYESDSNRIAYFTYYKSLCYKGLKEYDRALGELKSIDMRIVADSLYLMISYEKALCSYMKNDPEQALRSIDEAAKRFKDTTVILDFIPLNILCLNAGRKFERASRLWDYYLEKCLLPDSAVNIFREEQNNLYEQSNIPRYYSPVKAQKLSSFVPGSGQIYCGAIGEGSFNFLINISLLSFTAWEVYSRYYFTGYFVGFRAFSKFYSGGIHRAGFLAEERNSESIRRFNKENTDLMRRIFDERCIKSVEFTRVFILTDHK